MTVIACSRFRRYHSNNHTQRLLTSQKNAYFEDDSTCRTTQNCAKSLRETGNLWKYSCTRYYVKRRVEKHDKVSCDEVQNLFKESDLGVVHFIEGSTKSKSRKKLVEQNSNGVSVRTDFIIGLVFPTKFRPGKAFHTALATGVMFPSKSGAGMVFSSGYSTFTIAFHAKFGIGIIFRTEFGTGVIFRTEFGTGVIFHTEFGTGVILCTEFGTCVMIYTTLGICVFYCTKFFYALVFRTDVCTREVCPREVCSRKVYTKEVCTQEDCIQEVCIRGMLYSELGSGTYRTVGRRKEGEQSNGKQKKSENGNKYGGKNGSDRSRRGSQGNGSSGIEGSGEGSGNGDDSSDDEDGDDEEQEDDEDDDEEEEEEDDDEEMEEDTDNVSAMAEDEAEDTTNGGGESLTEQQVRLELGKVTATTLEIHTTGGSIKDDVGDEDDQSTVTSEIAPAEPGTPVTLSGVIWKETMGGVLVVNLKWRNKTYSGSLIDHSRYGWANPRNLDEQQECGLSTSSRGSKGKKGKHKKATYTGNPLSLKMSDKRGSRFHHKGKHKKESASKSKTKPGSDTTEEGTRTRRRSCTLKTTSISPSPSPTPLIECPERNCNKKYKHINGLRYHQAHAHLDNAADGEDKDSYDEDDTKSSDHKEPLSANSKSSGSDDVKPLSHRKAKNQKANSKTSEVSELSLPEDSVQNGEKLAATEEAGDKFDVMDIKVESPEPMKIEESASTTTSIPNILEEAAKVIFDEPSQDLIVPSGIGIFSRMASQAMLAASHPAEYKYIGYEPMEEAVGEYGEKNGASVETQELDVTIKEEVIDEGHAGVARTSCKDEAEETFKLENAELRFNGAPSSELTAEEAPKTAEDDKTKWLPENAGKPRKTDGASVAKEQIKTSAAEIRSLPGYKHFRLPPNNNPGFVTQSTQDKYAKSLTLDTGLLDAKDPQTGGISKENSGTPRQERAGEKVDNKSMVWKIQGAPSASSASFQLTCESKARPGYMGSSRKPTVVTASTTWVPEVHPAVMTKMSCGSVSGQEILPEKPGPPHEPAGNLSPRVRETEEQEDERTKAELSKGDDERSKGTYSGKPARAVGVAHPFNAEKSEGEFALGMVGSITTEPVHVLYSKSSSPKMSVDLAHPEMNEVKKVRVEKTLEVPVGEVVPLAKTSRSAGTAPTARGSVMVGSEIRGNFSEGRGSMPEERVPQIVAPSPPLRDPQQGYTLSSVERSSPWRPADGHSPSREHEPRSRSDTGQQYTSQPRKPVRRSPAPDHRSQQFRSIAGGYPAADIGRRTPEKDTSERFPHRAMDKRLPFRNIDERLAQKDLNKGIPVMEVTRNSPGKDIPGGLNPRAESPRKDTPGSFHHRMAAERAGYRDPERRSPFSDAIPRRQYEKSPIRDRRSPAHVRRSPERDMVERPSYRDTSPNPLRDAARHSPYRERVVKQPGESEIPSQRKESRSPVGDSRTVENSRGYRMKQEVLTSKHPGDSMGSHRTAAENKYPRMSAEEEAMMVHARNAALYQYHTQAPQDGAAAREAMENYMMYLSRMSIAPGFDPRLMQAYPMLTAAQMPLLLQSAKENTMAKEERPKEMPEDIRRKTNNIKSEPPRSRREDAEMMANKRHAERMSSSARTSEKTEYESSQVKRSKPSEAKDAREIMDEREGGRMHLKTLEQQALQQALQHRMDALNQLQTEKNLKLKAEEKSIRTKPQSSSSSSRPKPTPQEARTITKREDKGFSKEEKSRLSPGNIPSAATSTSTGEGTMTTRARNPENRSPVPTSSFPYLGFVPAPNLPANHALSNSYEQEAMAMQGYPPFMMPTPFRLPPGMIMANPLVPGGQFHSAVTARGLDPKRDPTRSTSSSNDRARPRDDDGHENESRNESRDFSAQTKKDPGTTPRINPPTPPPPRVEMDKDRPKEKPRGEYEEGKQRTMRDTSSLHGTPTLPANLAYRRGVIDPAQFPPGFHGMMYAGPQGSFRPSFEHPYISHQQRK